MNMQITLPAQLEDRLRQESERRGQGRETVVLRVLDSHLPPAIDERQGAAISLLKGWAKEDELLCENELAANVEVLRAIDADRPSDRKLFADIIEGEK